MTNSITSREPHRIFVASSKEAKCQARALIRDLDGYNVTFVPWWDSVLPGRMFLSELEEVARNVSAALFVFTPDIAGTFRRKRVKLPNQNVLFELGYFFTVVRPDRIAVVKYGDTMLPSDLLGYTHLTGSKSFKAGGSVPLGKATKASFLKWLAAFQSANPTTTMNRASLVKTAVHALRSGLSSAEKRAQEINCISNLKQVGLAARLWSNNHNDVLPNDLTQIVGDLRSEKIASCPADTTAQYKVLSQGISPTQPSVVFARCPIHNVVVLADGSVQRLGNRELVRQGGQWRIGS